MKTDFLCCIIISLLLANCAAPSEAGGTEAAAFAPMRPVEGGSWELVFRRDAEDPIRIAAFGDSLFGVTGGPSEAGRARFTVDGGVNWSPGRGSADCLFGIDIVDSQTVWQCSSGPVRVSTDGARTWTAATDYGNFCRLLSFLDAETGWIADMERLSLTRDGGRTWIRVALPDGIRNIAAMGLRTPEAGYLLDILGAFFVTIDGGATWSERDLPLDGGGELPDHDTASSAVRFMDSERGLVVVHIVDSATSRLIAFRTSDAGRTWSREIIMDVPLLVSVYLSHDARTLTVTDKRESKIVVLRNTEGG
jgi:hypothetical protein